MSDNVRTNLVTEHRDNIYPVTESKLIITESGMPLEKMINEKADSSNTVRLEGISEEGYAILSHWDNALGEWRTLPPLDVGNIEECGWDIDGEGVMQAILDLQQILPTLSRDGHRHLTSDLTDLHVITDRLIHLENNPNIGPEGRPGTDGLNGNDGITPHIDLYDKTWRIGNKNTGVVAEGRNGLDFTTRWNGKSFLAIGSTLTWQNEQNISGQTIIGYQQMLINQLNFNNFQTIAFEDSTLRNLIPTIAAANYDLHDLVIIEIGISDYKNSTPINIFYNDLFEIINIINSRNSTIPIMILTPLYLPGTSKENNEGNVLTDYINEVFKISNQFAIPVCDLYHNSGVAPMSAAQFMHTDTLLNNSGFNRVSMNIVGAVHMFNGASSIKPIADEDEAESFKDIEPIIILPHVTEDATEIIQELLNKNESVPTTFVFPNGVWQITNLDIPNDTTLLLSENTTIMQSDELGFPIFNCADKSNIKIINGRFETETLCRFNNCTNIEFENIYNNGGYIYFNQSSKIKISGHIENISGDGVLHNAINIEESNNIELKNITFYQCNLNSMIQITASNDIDIDKIIDYQQIRSNSGIGVIYLKNWCQRVRIGENINLGFDTLINNPTGHSSLIKKGMIEELWQNNNSIDPGEFMILSVPIEDFSNLCFHLDDGTVVPVDIRSGRFIIRDNILNDNYVFLRESLFVLNGQQAIHFENHKSNTISVLS